MALVLAMLPTALAAGSLPVWAAHENGRPNIPAGWTSTQHRDPATAGTRAIVVKLAPGANHRSIQRAAASLDASTATSPGLAELGYALLHVPAERLPEALARLRQDASVASAELARIVASTETIPDDPHWSQQYGPARIQAPNAWTVAPSGRPVIVAIIDSGADYEHPDLQARMWSNSGEVPGNGLDDDDNGYSDDWLGWDFANGDNDPQDDNGHGTHVAGIAGAASNNSLGIAGVAWRAELMALKVLQANGVGFDYHVADAIVYAAKNGAEVINLSLGGTLLGTVVEDAAIFAQARGVTLVAAAGNQGQAGLLYPAAYDSVIAVTATDSSDLRAAYSNYGPEAELAAPGSAIYATLPGGSYGYMWGTSMAAPHVAGSVALLAGLPEFTSSKQIRDALHRSALDLGDPGRDPYHGYGLVQIFSALMGTAACGPDGAAGCTRVFFPLLATRYSP